MRPIGSQYLAIIGNESMEYFKIYAVNKRNIEGTNEHLWQNIQRYRGMQNLGPQSKITPNSIGRLVHD